MPFYVAGGYTQTHTKKRTETSIFLTWLVSVFFVWKAPIHYVFITPPAWTNISVQTAADPMVCQTPKKPEKSLNPIVSKGETGMRTREGEARNWMRLWDSVRQNIGNSADALVRPIPLKYGCVCKAAFHCWYYTKFRRKNKERNVKIGMRLWRFCASRFIPAKELLYQQRIPFSERFEATELSVAKAVSLSLKNVWILLTDKIKNVNSICKQRKNVI